MNLHFCERENRACHTESLGDCPGVSHKAERERENCGQASLVWLPWEGISESGRAGSGLASLNNCRGLWVVRAVPGCLGPGPEAIRVGVSAQRMRCQ